MTLLRPAREGELDLLAGIHERAFDDSWSRDDIAGWLVHPEARILVAESAGESAGGVAGFAIVMKAGDDAEILTIAVDPAVQGQGTGFALMQAIDAVAVEWGLANWFLEVASDNAPAIALYRKSGFAEAGVRRGYYRRTDGRVDALVMMRTVGGIG